MQRRGTSKNFQKPSTRQNSRIKVADIDRVKIDLTSILAVITVIKDDEIYVLRTIMGKLKAPYTRNEFIFSEEFFFKQRRTKQRVNKCM